VTSRKVTKLPVRASVAPRKIAPIEVDADITAVSRPMTEE